MKLYYSPGACSLASHIVASEAGLDVTLDKINWAPKRTTESGEDYYAINPQGAVPALKLDTGEVLTENAVIMQYLAAQAPQANLVPANGIAHWRTLETVNFIATELHKGISPLFKNPNDEVKAATVKNVVSRFELLEGKLNDKSYLLGDQFTIADAYAFVMLLWARKFEIAPSPKLAAYFSRVAARPGVQKALQEEGLRVA